MAASQRPAAEQAAGQGGPAQKSGAAEGTGAKPSRRSCHGPPAGSHSRSVPFTGTEAVSCSPGGRESQGRKERKKKREKIEKEREKDTKRRRDGRCKDAPRTGEGKLRREA